MTTDWQPPEYRGTARTRAEFCAAVADTLQYWLDVHTHPRAWALSWLVDDDAEYTLQQRASIGNQYFDFDLGAAVLRRWARDYRKCLWRCGRCGSIQDNGLECCCEPPRARYSPQPTNAQLLDWATQGGDDITGLCDIAEYVMPALEHEGFRTYREAVKPITAPIEDEIKAALASIDRAKYSRSMDWEDDGEDGPQYLAACLWASHLMHVNGNIVMDYGERFGLDWQDLRRAQQEGIDAVYPEFERPRQRPSYRSPADDDTGDNAEADSIMDVDPVMELAEDARAIY